MLRSATRQTSRVLRRSRTIPRVGQSGRQHSPDGTEGAQSVLTTLAMMGTNVALVFSILEQRRSDNQRLEMGQMICEMQQQIIKRNQEMIEWNQEISKKVQEIIEMNQEKREMEYQKIERVQQKIERQITKAREDNARQMFDEWSSIAPSRKAVLNKRYNNNQYLYLHKLLGMANKSEADKATPAPKSVANVIRFFLRWKFHHDNKTIDSVDLKKYLGSQFDTFRDILTEIRGDETRDWDEADLDNLNEVVDFLDKLSKMEMDR